MDEKKIHIDDLYRKELGNHTEQPDAAVWESIADRLNNQPERKAVPYKWLWRIAALLLLAGAVYLITKKLLNNNSTTNSSISNSTVAENKKLSSSSLRGTKQSEEYPSPDSHQGTGGGGLKTTTPAIEKNTANNKPDASLLNPVVTQASPANVQVPASDINNNITANHSNNTPKKTTATNNRATTGNRTLTSTTKGYAGYNTGTVAPTVPSAGKPKHTKNTNTVSDNNVYVTPPVYTYTPPTPVAAAPPAKKWHAPRFDPNSTGPLAQAGIALSYTQQDWKADAPVKKLSSLDKEEYASESTAGGGLNIVPAPAAITNPDDNIRKAIPFTFNYGAKAGYEFTKGDYHVNSYVVSPYIQFNLTRKLSLVLQPGIKMSTINKTFLDGGQSYYNITSASLDSNHHKIQTSVDSTEKPVYGAIKPKYYYTQTHDSIVTSTAIAGKTYFEFELPVLVQYEVVKYLRVYGGVSANFSKIAEVKEQREEYKNITLKDSVILKPQAATTTSVVPSPYNKFSYNYAPYSQYNAVQNPTGSPVRFSYMLGFNYQMSHRFYIDVLMQGSLTNPTYIYDSRVRSIYQQTHFRISLGYQFGK